MSQRLDGGCEGADGSLQGQAGLALLRYIGNMDKAYPGGSARKVVQEGVERVVADKGAGRIGHRGGDLDISDRLGHGFHGQGGKIGGGAVGGHVRALGLVAGVVRDPGITDVHGDPLGGDGIAACGQPHAQDHVRVAFLRCGQHGFGGKTKDGGDS